MPPTGAKAGPQLQKTWNLSDSPTRLNLKSLLSWTASSQILVMISLGMPVSAIIDLVFRILLTRFSAE